MSKRGKILKSLKEHASIATQALEAMRAELLSAGKLNHEDGNWVFKKFEKYLETLEESLKKADEDDEQFRQTLASFGRVEKKPTDDDDLPF